MENQNPNISQQTQPIEQKYWGMSENGFASLMHISQFSSIVIPIAGIILPIVMWTTNRTNKLIDNNGKRMMNWMVSSLIYLFIFGGFAIASTVGLLASAESDYSYNSPYDSYNSYYTPEPEFDEDMAVGVGISTGFVVLIVFLGAIFPIIAAVKAGKGLAWKYPLSIPFFKVRI